MDPHTVSSSNIYLGALGNFPGTFAHLTGNEHPPQVCTLYKRILEGGGGEDEEYHTVNRNDF